MAMVHEVVLASAAWLLPGKRWKTMMIVSLHVSVVCRSREGGRAGEIPKITAPDSQKQSSTEGGGCFGGGRDKTDVGWPHIGRPALITAMHQIPIGSTDFWSGARKRRGGDFLPLSSSVIFDSRLFIQSDDPQSGKEREEGRDGDENCTGRSMFYYVNYEVVDSLCQPSRNILTQ